MKKLVLVLVVFALTMALTGCVENGIEPYVITETEIVEVEIPVIVVETEVVIVEVPQIIVETEVVEIIREIEIPVFVSEESRTLFYTADTDLAIFVISRGETSYVMEFKFVDPMIGNSYMEIVQIEKQTNGETDDWFFMNEYSENINGDLFQFEVEDYYGFTWEVEDRIDGMIWENVEFLYQEMYNDYYETPALLNVGQIAEFDIPYESSIIGYYGTDVYQLELEHGMQVKVMVITTSEIDVNIYDNTLIWYDYFDYATYTTVVTEYTFDCINGGIYYFEVEQFYNVTTYYTIEFTIGGDSA